jgi:acetyltransferase
VGRGLAGVMVRFGDLMLAARRIVEADINPLVATSDGVLALDARLVIRSPADTGREVPVAAMCGG